MTLTQASQQQSDDRHMLMDGWWNFICFHYSFVHYYFFLMVVLTAKNWNLVTYRMTGFLFFYFFMSRRGKFVILFIFWIWSLKHTYTYTHTHRRCTQYTKSQTEMNRRPWSSSFIDFTRWSWRFSPKKEEENACHNRDRVRHTDWIDKTLLSTMDLYIYI